MKRTILSALSLLALLPALARVLSPGEAQAVAERTLSELRQHTVAVNCLQPAQVGMKAPAIQGKPAAYYMFVAQDGSGFAIVSAESRMPPVVGYSATGSLDNGRTLPPALQALLADYAKQVEAVRSGAVEPTEAPQPTAADAHLPTECAPLLATRWGQDAPFNQLCPEGCPSGCVATALAQIMLYHRWPEHGTGVVQTKYEGRALKANLDDSYYQWDAMLPSADQCLASEEASLAVATLMRDLGYALEMDYAPDGSSSSDRFVLQAVVKNFGYKASSLRFLDYETVDGPDAWCQIIKQELSAARPVYYSARDANEGGHAFVADGYDRNNLLHINWGWDGAADGYFDVTRMAVRSYKFVNDQSVLLGIIPARNGEPGEYVHYPQIQGQTTVDVNQLNYGKTGTPNFNVTLPIIYNMSCETLRWAVSAGLYDANNQFLTTIQARSKTNTLEPYNGIASQEITCKIPAGYPDGEYSIRTTVKEGSTLLEPDVMGGYQHNRVFLTIQGGKVRFGTPEPTAIGAPRVGQASPAAILDFQGRWRGTLWDALPPGIYIQNGRKVMKK